MSYKIEINESIGLVKRTYLDNVSLDERLSIIHEICRLPPKLLKNIKLLIDVRLSRNTMTDTEQEIFGTFVSTVQELKTAIVAVLNDDVQATNKIAINISSKKGHNIKVFNAELEAMKWLNI